MAKHYSDKPVDKWTTNDFLAYMDDLHQEIFGVEYAPMRSWNAERGILGQAIGTQKKPGEYSKTVIKRFIDECFHTYKPTQQYPGTSFMFMYTYRKADLPRIILAEKQREKDEVEADSVAKDKSDISDWFNS